MEQAESNGACDRHSVLARLQQRRAERAVEDARNRDSAFADVDGSSEAFLHPKESIHHPCVAAPKRVNPRCARLLSKAQESQVTDLMDCRNAEPGIAANPDDTGDRTENNECRELAQTQALEESATMEDDEEAMRQLLTFDHPRTAARPELAPDSQDQPQDVLESGTAQFSAAETIQLFADTQERSPHLAQLRVAHFADDFEVDSEGSSSPSPSHRMTAHDEGRLWEAAQRDVMTLLGSTPERTSSPVANNNQKVALHNPSDLPRRPRGSATCLQSSGPQSKSSDSSIDIQCIKDPSAASHRSLNGKAIEERASSKSNRNGLCSIDRIGESKSQHSSSDFVRMSFRYLRLSLCRAISEIAAHRRAERRAPLEAAIQRHMNALHDADIEPAVRKLQAEWRKYRMRVLFHRMDLAARRLQRFFRRRWLRQRLEREVPLEQQRLENERRRIAMAPPPPPSRRPQNREPQPKAIDPYSQNPQVWHTPRGNSALLACPPPLKKPHQPRSQNHSPAVNNGKILLGEMGNQEGYRKSENTQCLDFSEIKVEPVAEVTSIPAVLTIPPPPRAWPPPRSDMSQRSQIETLSEDAFASKASIPAAVPQKKHRNLIATMGRGKVYKGQSIKSVLPNVTMNDTWGLPAQVLGSPRRRLDIV